MGDSFGSCEVGQNGAFQAGQPLGGGQSGPVKARFWRAWCSFRKVSALACQEQVIANKNLIPLAEAVDALALARAEDALLPLSAQQEHQDLISAAVQTHLKIPVGKGSGHRSVEHLGAAWAHCTILELEGLQHFKSVCREHVAVCTDLGPESGIRSFTVPDAEGLSNRVNLSQIA